MTLSDEPASVEARRRELRRLLVGRQITYPAMAYGLLGYDPNELRGDDMALLADDLRVLGYVRKLRQRPYHSAYTSAWWWREDSWPEDIDGSAPYAGIALRPDPDLADWDPD